MTYTRFPGAGISVSVPCLGTMNFGWPLDENESIRCIDYALDQGVNFVDCSNTYNRGGLCSEEILGRAIKGKRSKIVLGTKVGGIIGTGPNEFGLSRKHILEQIDQSLVRLGTDYIDIYYLHRPDPSTPMLEILSTLDSLVRMGKIRYYGISNHSTWQTCEAYFLSKEKSFHPPIATQMPYNLLNRSLEAELADFIKKYNMGLVVYNPLAGGLLSGKYDAQQVEAGTRFQNEIYKKRYWNQLNFNIINSLKKIADMSGIALLELSYRWLLSKPYVNSILLGYSSLGHLQGNLDFLQKGPLSPDIVSACDDLCNEMQGNTLATESIQSFAQKAANATSKP